MKTIYTLFEKSAALYADEIAIFSKDKSLTYAQVQERVALLSASICSITGQEKLIALPTTRGVEQIIGMLAILKAGKAYLPLDLNYPAERLAHIIENSGVSFCLSTSADSDAVVKTGLSALSFEGTAPSFEFAEKPIQNKLAYILYTSGSTGIPKGVAMGQEALVNLIHWQNSRSTAIKATRTLQFAPLSFDVSFQEILTTLTTGGMLMLITEAMRLDLYALLKFIEDEHINRLFLPFVALQALSEAAVSSCLYPGSLKEIMTAGEQLRVTPQLIQFFTALSGCSLYNQYGPTECHVVSELKLDGSPENWNVLPNIGKPIDNTEIYILDENFQVLPDGERGELCVAGLCLAEGYLGQDELTKENFIDWKAPNGNQKRIYKTGDIARYRSDGNLEFLGRSDDQVKIRGHRIELGEIEVALNRLKGIHQAVVVAIEKAGQNRLVAYLQSNAHSKDLQVLQKLAEAVLPHYMLPEIYVWLDDFPKTSSGKIDKKKLPVPSYSRPASAPAFRKPENGIQKNISIIWQNLLEIEEIGIDDNFFELGGSSLLAQKVVANLRKSHAYEVPITKLYQFPTITALSNFIGGSKKTVEFSQKLVKKDGKGEQNIAVVGMAGRFPGANTISEFWDVLSNGEETIRFFNDEELAPSVPSALRNNPLYVRARGILEHAKEFDSSFFGLSPKIAQAMDPQQRMFLEIAWEALEQSGHLEEHYDGSVGVFAGCGNNTYYLKNILPNAELVSQVGDFQAMTLNEKDYIASRTAYQLNLKGPAVSVFSACSTSLLAISQAVQHIRSGQCEVALAGGASITSPIASGHLYQEGAMYSPDGHSRPFDADAKGTVFSDGAGVVVLKNLEAAQKDGDTIYGIIKGIGINNDGRTKGSFTAPSAEGQADAIRRALNDGNVDPSTISYIEAHGTGTPLGDPIEFEGLKMAFGEHVKKGYCAIGSVKSNIGHLTAASGVAGFIKTLLALHYQKIPASLGYKKANPMIDFKESPFFVNTALKEWKQDHVRRAGISSFGVGGTNVHVILEESVKTSQNIIKNRPFQLISWSAKTEKSLENYADQLANHLLKSQETRLDDAAYTLHSTRATFDHRHFIVASSKEDAVESLLKFKKRSSKITSSGEVVFQFPGQGAQYLQMGRDLYENEPAYKKAIDICAEILQPYLDCDIRSVIYATENNEDSEKKLKDTRYAQAALFVTEYATARLWMSWNIKPSLLCGHSVGEFVAAHLAGIFSLKDALRLIAQRGKLISALPQGSMLSLRLPIEELKAIIPENLSIAAINSKQLCVVSGTDEAIDDFISILGQKRIPHKKLATSHAFHSYMMDPVVEDFIKIVEDIKLHRPQLPLISSVSGTWMTDAEALDANYWARHLRNTVNYADVLETVMQQDQPILLEIGPGKTLSTLAYQQISGKSFLALSSLPTADHRDSAYEVFLNTLGELWLHGLKPDWHAYYTGQSQNKIMLPSYAFDRTYCWAEEIVLAPVQTIIQKIESNKNSQIIPENGQKAMKTGVIGKIIEVISKASGIEVGLDAIDRSFLELGLDSLILTQLAILCKKEFDLPITFRQLNEELSSPELLAGHIERIKPQETPIFDKSSIKSKRIEERMEEELTEHQKPFGASPKIERKESTGLSESQQDFLAKLIRSYTVKTAGSKAYTQKHRGYMADPRVVSGFKPLTKEIVYPILIERSLGNRLWDIDGNAYLDVLNGFGSSLFGHQPDFIKDVLHDQIEKGYEVGPQHPLAGEVCELLCEFTGHDRAALCNTGSEAVLGAMRIARTVTGRSLIVAFSGSYHGINDEVIVRGSKKQVSFPAAPGIMPEAVQNMLILDYGTPESLQIIKDRSHELAAVLVEPVQSRRPEFQPIEFLKEVREITKKSGTTLIFDEVITGFRMHPGGAQALFAIQADLATYGKVIGGGMPIGAIMGKRKFMDALDGGFWEYGNTSYPEVGVTYFAGTFVRHPLALAAAKASLLHLREKGPALQEDLNAKTHYLATTLNKAFDMRGLGIQATQFGSLWRLKFISEMPYSELLFTSLREKGIHIWDGFPCFLTTAYTQEDVTKLIDSILERTDALVNAGFFYKEESVKHSIDKIKEPVLTGNKALTKNLNTPPVGGARLAMDKDGNPAWFVPDTSNGSYIRMDIEV